MLQALHLRSLNADSLDDALLSDEVSFGSAEWRSLNDEYRELYGYHSLPLDRITVVA